MVKVSQLYSCVQLDIFIPKSRHHAAQILSVVSVSRDTGLIYSAQMRPRVHFTAQLRYGFLNKCPP